MALSPTLVKLRVILLYVILVKSRRTNVGIILGFKFNQVIVIIIQGVISTFQLSPRLINLRLEHLLRDFLSYFDYALFLISSYASTLQQLLGQLNSQVFSFANVGSTQASHKFEVCMLEVGILIVSDNKTRLVSDFACDFSLHLPGVDLRDAFKYGLVFSGRPSQTP